MHKRRIVMQVEVDLDPIPGSFHEPENARDHVESMLRHSIPHYCPSVELVDEYAVNRTLSDKLEQEDM